jgi:hypothetical protein
MGSPAARHGEATVGGVCAASVCGCNSARSSFPPHDVCAAFSRAPRSGGTARRGAVALSHHQDRSPQSFLRDPLTPARPLAQIGQSGRLWPSQRPFEPTVVKGPPEDLRPSRHWIAQCNRAGFRPGARTGRRRSRCRWPASSGSNPRRLGKIGNYGQEPWNSADVVHPGSVRICTPDASDGWPGDRPTEPGRHFHQR